MSTGADSAGEGLNATVPAVEVDHAPARLSAAMAVGAGLVAALVSGLASVLALLFGLFGLGGIAAGLFLLNSRRATTVGTGILFLSVVVSGLLGNTTGALVFSAVATILAFDLGQNAFSVGQQMSTETRTTRGELVHAAASMGVGALAVTVAYAVFLASAPGQPAAMLVFLLLGAVLLAWALRSE